MQIMELCLSAGLGGLELYVYRTAQYLSNAGIKPLIIVRPESQLSNYIQSSRLQVHELKPGLRYFPLFTAFRLARLIQLNNIDMLHMHWAKDLMLVVLAKLFCRKRIKIVYTRQMAILGDKHDFYHKFVYSFIDCLITITRELEQQAKEYLPLAKEKIIPLYYGTPVYQGKRGQDRDRLIETLNVSKDSFIVGLVGRIEHAKGQHLLIRAVEHLRNKDILVHAVFIGGAKNREYLQKLESEANQAGLGKTVHFYGFHKNAKQAMAGFDIAVLATDRETFGLVLIEAMSTGTPAIGTRAGGVPEIINDGITGLMFTPGDSQELADCIEKLYKDSMLRKKMGEAGKKRVFEIFIEEKHYRNLVTVLEAILIHRKLESIS